MHGITLFFILVAKIKAAENYAPETRKADERDEAQAESMP